MTTRPIILAAESVRAIIDGRKTQTRRVVKWPVAADADEVFAWFAGQEIRDTWPHVSHDGLYQHSPRGLQWLGPCPFGSPGDTLWVREAWYYDIDPLGPIPKEKPANHLMEHLYYRANGECCEQIPECQCAETGPTRWRSPLHMPRWASRLTLRVKAVRVERVQAISEADCVAEGAEETTRQIMHTDGTPSRDIDIIPARIAYAEVWDRINGKRHPWASNPFCWVIEFERIEQGANDER